MGHYWQINSPEDSDTRKNSDVAPKLVKMGKMKCDAKQIAGQPIDETGRLSGRCCGIIAS